MITDKTCKGTKKLYSYNPNPESTFGEDIPCLGCVDCKSRCPDCGELVDSQDRHALECEFIDHDIAGLPIIKLDSLALLSEREKELEQMLELVIDLVVINDDNDWEVLQRARAVLAGDTYDTKEGSD